MNKYIAVSFEVLIILAVIFVLIFFTEKNILTNLFSGSVNSATSTSTEKLLNNKAPYFDLTDISGNRITLNNFLGTPVVVVFWSTWNKESADQIKILDDYILSKNIQNSLIKILAIDSLEEGSVVNSFVRRGGYDVPIVLDITGDISSRYNIKSLPTTYFIDKDGYVKEIYTGVLSQSMIVDKVDNLLK